MADWIDKKQFSTTRLRGLRRRRSSDKNFWTQFVKRSLVGVTRDSIRRTKYPILHYTQWSRVGVEGVEITFSTRSKRWRSSRGLRSPTMRLSSLTTGWATGATNCRTGPENRRLQGPAASSIRGGRAGTRGAGPRRPNRPSRTGIPRDEASLRGPQRRRRRPHRMAPSARCGQLSKDLAVEHSDAQGEPGMPGRRACARSRHRGIVSARHRATHRILRGVPPSMPACPRRRLWLAIPSDDPPRGRLCVSAERPDWIRQDLGWLVWARR